jgi:hypothetical protein
MIAERENDESPSRGQDDRGWGSAPALKIAPGNRIANQVADHFAMVMD